MKIWMKIANENIEWMDIFFREKKTQHNVATGEEEEMEEKKRRRRTWRIKQQTTTTLKLEQKLSRWNFQWN